MGTKAPNIGKTVDQVARDVFGTAKPNSTQARSSTPARYRKTGRPEELSSAEWDKIPRPFKKALTAATKANRWPIYIFGLPGRGKSCAMSVLFDMWVGRAHWYRMSSLMADIAACRKNGGSVMKLTSDGSPRHVTELNLWKRLSSRDLICIDDFALSEVADWIYEIVWEIVDRRNGKPTVITSNISPSGVQRVYDGRVSSRISAGPIIEVTGEDLRSKDTVTWKA